MLDLLKQKVRMTETENGAATYETSGSECLDLFASIGAFRHAGDEEIINCFIRAYTENADLAMKILFYARDIRGGLGERHVFRTILSWLAKNETESVKKNLTYISEYGRFDDLLTLLDTPCEKEMLDLLKLQFTEDLHCASAGEHVSLLAKWLPSVNTSNKQAVRNAKRIARAFGMNDAAYRKNVVLLRSKIHIIENYLREKDYSFDYEKQPSRAMYKYRDAFERNDEERYHTFLSLLSEGKAKLHADHVCPYELVEPYLTADLKNISEAEKRILNATWDSLPDYGNNEDALAVIDTSGSMYWSGRPLPAAVALSLGIYLADHNKGRFRNHFIEFSARPQLIEMKGKTFVDKLRYIMTFNEIADTNLESVFDLILHTAMENHMSQEEMPSKLVIISDMEFNCCVENASETNFENARKKYAANHYRLPQIIFWNVAGRHRQQPVTMNEQGVVLISGVTPKLFQLTMGGQLSPYTYMMKILESERYAKIIA